MQIHPAIAALRSNRALQRQAQSIMDGAAADWREQMMHSGLADALKAYGAGTDLNAAHPIVEIMTSYTAASAFVDGWCRAVEAALEQAPLGQVPVRHSCSAGLSRVQLLSVGRATVSLLAYDRLPDLQERATVPFADRETTEMVVAGEASGSFYMRGSRDIRTEKFRWQAGDTIQCLPNTQARQFVEVQGSMLVLQLTRERERPGPTREFRLADGALVHQSSGDKRASQNLMAVAVLGALDARHSLPVMANVAHDRQGDADLRWEAVRQSIAMDTKGGMDVLESLANQTHDPLNAPARSLLDDLNSQLEAQSCPA